MFSSFSIHGWEIVCADSGCVESTGLVLVFNRILCFKMEKFFLWATCESQLAACCGVFFLQFFKFKLSRFLLFTQSCSNSTRSSVCVFPFSFSKPRKMRSKRFRLFFWSRRGEVKNGEKNFKFLIYRRARVFMAEQQSPDKIMIEFTTLAREWKKSSICEKLRVNRRKSRATHL